MKNIPFDDPHRKEHFEFFTKMASPHFSICATLELNAFLETLKKNSLPFNISIVHTISKTANNLDRFKQRVRPHGIIEHTVIHPSYSIPTKASSVFSFCTVDYTDNYEQFRIEAQLREALLQTDPSFKDEEGRDDFVFMSAIPWIHFTGFNHAMHTPVKDSVPRIVWGKYKAEHGIIKLPVSVQVHHAVIDGKEVGQFYEELQNSLNTFKGI